MSAALSAVTMCFIRASSQIRSQLKRSSFPANTVVYYIKRRQCSLSRSRSFAFYVYSNGLVPQTLYESVTHSLTQGVRGEKEKLTAALSN